MAKKATTQPALAVEFVVRRGARRRYQELKEKTAALPVKVSWDRRRADRRVASGQAEAERRKADRRQNPPFTWEVGDFVVKDATGRGHLKLKTKH